MRMSQSILKKAGILINSGDLKKALNVIEKALNINRYNAYGWNLKGRVLDALNRDAEAQECYEKAKKCGMDAILFLAGQKGIPRSLNTIDSRLIAPIGYIHDEDSWTLHAVSLVSLLKFEEALICYNKALEFNPNYIPALENKELLLKLTGWKE